MHKTAPHTSLQRKRTCAIIIAAVAVSGITLGARADQQTSNPTPAIPSTPAPGVQVSMATPAVSDPQVLKVVTPSVPVVQPTFTVSVIDGFSAPQALTATTQEKVSDLLQTNHIALNNDDRVLPPLNSYVTAGAKVIITRIAFKTDTVDTVIPYKVVFTMSPSVPAGQIQNGSYGANGLKETTYETGFVNGKQTQRWIASERVLRQPVNEEHVGGIRTREAMALPSRGGMFQRERCFSMIATGYSPYEGSGSGRCATGMRAGYGVVAVDPRVIPLGTHLYISGYGYAIAGDTGGAIKGMRVDLGHTTYSEAEAVGRRPVTVWILNDAGR